MRFHNAPFYRELVSRDGAKLSSVKYSYMLNPDGLSNKEVAFRRHNPLWYRTNSAALIYFTPNAESEIHLRV